MTSTVDLPTQRDDEYADDESTASPEAIEAPEHTDEHDQATAAEEHDEAEDRADAEPTKGRESQRAQWEAEYNRVIHFDANDVVIDENVRTENAVTDPDTVRDMRHRGVETPVRGYRADDATVMITLGQRRVLNAREAGCHVPVWMQPPPPADKRKAEIQRIVAQVNENDLRVGLTRGDEYRAVQQLAAFNLTPTGIARKLNRGPGGAQRVENMLRVGDSELAAKAADRYDLTLEHAAIVAEFEGYGDLDTAKELIRLAVEAPNNFKVFAERKRQDHAEDERVRDLTEQLTRELTEAGVALFDPSVSELSGDARSLDRLRPAPDSEQGSPLTAEEHASCPGHGAWIEEDYDDEDNRIVVAVYGCSDFRAHGHALSHAPVGKADFSTDPPPATPVSDSENSDEEEEEDETAAAAAAAAAEERARRAASIQRRWVIENNKLWDAAVTVRRQWLADFALRKTAPKGAQLFLAVQKAKGSHELRRAMERNHKLAHQLLNVPEPGYGQPSQLPDKIAVASAAKATVYDVFLTLCAFEADLTRDAWRRPWQFEQDYLSTIISWGYDASDVERKVLDPEREEDVVAARLCADESTGDVEVDGTGEVEAEDGDKDDEEDDEGEDGPEDHEFRDEEADPEPVDASADAEGEPEPGEAGEAGDMSEATV